MAGGGTGGGPRLLILGKVAEPMTGCWLLFSVFKLFLRPVGLSLGIPPAKRPPKPTGLPLLLFAQPFPLFDNDVFKIELVDEALVELVVLEHIFPYEIKWKSDEIYFFIITYLANKNLPAIAGALLSMVTVFFKGFPALIDCNKAPLLWSAEPPPPKLKVGGGGGGGPGILNYKTWN